MAERLSQSQVDLLLKTIPGLRKQIAATKENTAKMVTRWWESSNSGIKKYGSWDKFVKSTQPKPKPVPKVPAPTVEAAPMEIPPSLASDPNFQQLPDDLKQIAVYSYNIQKQNDEQKAQALAAAYDEAVKQADPYWKNIIRIAQDELMNSFDAAKGDYASIQERLNRRISELNTDLQSTSEFLNLEQQQELANLALSYTRTRDTLVESSAQSGLTFSTKRKLAEQQLGEYQSGMVESTKRQYQKQISDLEREVASGNIAAQKDLEEAKRKYNEQILNLGRAAEQYLGTENLPAAFGGLSERDMDSRGAIKEVDESGNPKTAVGYTPLGNVPGQLYEEKVKDIAARQQGLYDEATQASLNF